MSPILQGDKEPDEKEDIVYVYYAPVDTERTYIQLQDHPGRADVLRMTRYLYWPVVQTEYPN